MNELTDEEFTRIVVQKIEELNLNVLLENPDTEADYPCVVVSDTYSDTIYSSNLVPILKKFQISIEPWATKKYETMSILNQIAIKLREINLTPTGYPTEQYDNITNKHRRMINFEVYYNGLTNSFDQTIN